MSKMENDFSDRVVSAYNKYILVAAISIAASSFTISKKSGFLGINFQNLNERALEFGLLVSTFVLGINYALRLADEFNVLSQTEKILKKTNFEIDQLISNIESSKNQLHSCSEQYETALNSIINTVKNHLPNEIERHLEKIKPLIGSKGDGLGRATPEHYIGKIVNIDNYLDQIQIVKLNQKNIIKISEENINQIKLFREEIIHKLINKINLSTFQKRNFAPYNKSRILLIDITIPLIMIILAIASFLYPNENAPIFAVVEILFGEQPVSVKDAS